jgi:hypothetical protein
VAGERRKGEPSRWAVEREFLGAISDIASIDAPSLWIRGSFSSTTSITWHEF